MLVYLSLHSVKVPQNINSHSMESHQNYKGKRGSQNPKCLKESTKVNWNFLKGWGLCGAGAQIKKTFQGDGMDLFWNNTMGSTDYCCTLLGFL